MITFCKWVCYGAFAVNIISASSLKAQIGSMGMLNSSQAIADSDCILEGSFVLNQALSGINETFVTSLGQKLDGTSFMIPFKVDASTKGNETPVVYIKLFYPANPITVPHWLLPIRQKLLLFLKKNPDGKSFSLLDPFNSWLVVKEPIAVNSEVPDPNKFILSNIKSFLKYCLAHPNDRIQYPSSPLGNVPYETFDPDPNTIRALRLGQQLGMTDAEFIQIAKQYMNATGQVGLTARIIVAMSGDYQDTLRRLKDHNQMKGVTGNYLEVELNEGIRGCSNLDAIMPLISAALASPDPRIRLYATRGLTQSKSKGKELYPLLIGLLDDPDQEVQLAAMSCIYYMSPSSQQYYPNQEIHLPSHDLFLKNPNLYIGQYKAWWDKNKDSLK